jgi:outer membrane murein-binding lipoprotein Lpp
MPGHAEIAAKPISEATIDDLAFAMRGLEAEFNDVADKMQALRKLSQIARDAGGLGADRAVEVAARIQAER